MNGPRRVRTDCPLRVYTLGDQFYAHTHDRLMRLRTRVCNVYTQTLSTCVSRRYYYYYYYLRPREWTMGRNRLPAARRGVVQPFAAWPVRGRSSSQQTGCRLWMGMSTHLSPAPNPVPVTYAAQGENRRETRCPQSSQCRQSGRSRWVSCNIFILNYILCPLCSIYVHYY